MEESVAGFKIAGTWADVVEHGERITYALRDLGVGDPDDEQWEYRDAFHEWNEWRPKAHEEIDDDVNEKTADKASVGEGKGEEAGKAPNEDVQTAGEKLGESYEKLSDNDSSEAVEKWSESLDYMARAADSAGRKALRKLEDAVYRKVMTRFGPYYFDNDLISANIVRKRRTDEFVFEVNINDDELKQAVSERLAEIADEYERWHVDTVKDTDTAEDAEGHQFVSDSTDDAHPDAN